MVNNSKEYLDMLIQASAKKLKILNELLSLSADQEEIIQKDMFEVEHFDIILERKEVLVRELEKLDEGFATVYDRIREELSANGKIHQQEVVLMQKLIRQISEKVLLLESQEKRNRDNLNPSMARARSKIKNYNVSNRLAASYYKNMSGKYSGESAYLDNKK